MPNKPLSDNFKDRIIKFYQALDCKYFVFKIDDLINSINEEDYLVLINMMEKYNNYRAENDKSESKYFVVNRDELPRFKTFNEFYTWLISKNNQSKSE